MIILQNFIVDLESQRQVKIYPLDSKLVPISLDFETDVFAAKKYNQTSIAIFDG
jgi:hypothetical protein